MIEKELKSRILNECDGDKKRSMILAGRMKYNIPVGYMADILNLKIPISECPKEVVFAIIDLAEFQDLKLQKNEADILSKWRYEEQVVGDDFKFEVVKVCDNHWIGRINLKNLIVLRDADKLDYSLDNQNKMMKEALDGKTYYQVALNQSSIDNIKNLMSQGLYIPDEITLSIPSAAKCDYSDHELTITNADKLTIIDGCHRYIAMCQLYDENNKQFDYNIELRLIQEDDTFIKQFIYQKSQRVPKNKSKYYALNQMAIENQIVNRISDDPECLLHENINLGSKAIINSANLAECIYEYYLKDKNVSAQIGMIETLPDELSANINRLVKGLPKLSKRRWSKKETAAILFAFSKGITRSEVIDTMLKEMAKVKDVKNFPSKAFADELEKIVGDANVQ